MTRPFAVPARLSPDLERVNAYWRGLLRGGAEMPFWDDARPTELPDLAPRLLLIDVFADPERFRFERLGRELSDDNLAGCFLDETPMAGPLVFLRAQCSATVEASAPTWFRHDGGAGGDRSFSRLLLPMWGDGRIGMLLGLVEFA